MTKDDGCALNGCGVIARSILPMKKYLVVDDEYLIGYSLSTTFKDADTEVVTASDGAAALKAINENQFDVCFLDLHLPDMSGIDIMKVLRSASPRTKIIVMSGENPTEDMKKTIHENASLFMEKPFDLDFVKSFVNVVVDGMGGPAADRRRHARTAADRTVTYSAVSPTGTHKGDGLEASLCDISDSGVGICTSCALEPGCRVTIAGEGGRNEGVVRWSAANDGQDSYRVGVQFIE